MHVHAGIRNDYDIWWITTSGKPVTQSHAIRTYYTAQIYPEAPCGGDSGFAKGAQGTDLGH